MSAPGARTVLLDALRDLSAETGAWWPATALARRVRLPLPDVRRALAEMAEVGRAERAVHAASGRLQERWRLAAAAERRGARAAG